MVLPLLALAGVGGLMAGGKTLLQDYLQGQRQENQRRRMNDALQAGMVGPQMVEGPRQDPNFVGPGAPMQQPGYFDPQLMAMELARQGDPQGLAMLAQQGQQQQGFQNQLALQQGRMDDQWQRMLWEQANQPQPPTVNIGGEDWPYEPIPLGSSEWMDLERQRTGLDRVYDIMDEFRQVMQESGSESFGATAQKLGALRAELINARALASEAGALQEAEIEFYGSMVPDPTRWTPEFFTQESGKLEALADWYNAQARGLQNRLQFTRGIQPLRMFPSQSLVPQGWTAVDESEIVADQPERRGQRPNREEVTVEGLPRVTPLQELIDRANAGGYVSPSEWRGTQ